MKAKIVHESSARLRVKLARPLTVREADLMQAWLSRESGAKSVTVHERTGLRHIRIRARRARWLPRRAGQIFLCLGGRAA